MSTFLTTLAAIAAYHALIFWLDRWLSKEDKATRSEANRQRTFQERMDEKKNGLSK